MESVRDPHLQGNRQKLCGTFMQWSALQADIGQALRQIKWGKKPGYKSALGGCT